MYIRDPLHAAKSRSDRSGQVQVSKECVGCCYFFGIATENQCLLGSVVGGVNYLVRVSSIS